MALHGRVEVPPYPEAIEAMAEGIVRLNIVLMRMAWEKGGIELPPLYESGAVYRREAPGGEWWESAIDVLDMAQVKEGDCEDLANYRTAELRYFEREARARTVILRTQRGSFHAVVRRSSGVIEDPSRICLALERRRHEGAL